MASYKIVCILFTTTILTIIFYTADYNTIQIKNNKFEYTINSDGCDVKISIIIIVTSYFGNVETRSAMRRAFSSNKLAEFGIKRVFLLGLAPHDKYTKQNAIVAENRRFQDLVQGNFYESYRNLTYKHVMGHKWIAEFCPNVNFVIKMDDDIVVDLYKMKKILSNFKWKDRDVMAGYIFKNMKPIREPYNKWFVSEKEYNSVVYPTFLSGWCYITTPEISAKIFSLSQKIPYFWIDDVYITGILAEKLNVKHVDLNHIFTVQPEFLRCCINDLLKYGYECEFVVGPNGGDNNLYYEFNKVLKKCFYNICGRRKKFLNETCIAEVKFNIVGRGDAEVRTYKL